MNQNVELYTILDLISRANYINENGENIKYQITCHGPIVDVIFYIDKNKKILLSYDKEILNGYKNDEMHEIIHHISILENRINERKMKASILHTAREKLTDREFEVLQEAILKGR